MIATSTDPDSSLPGPLEQFEQELREASDPGAVLERYRKRYPELSEMLGKLADAMEMLQATPLRHAGEARATQDEVPHPERFGPYRVVRSIGRGGMGEVYEAIEEPLGRRVAVKTIRPSESTSAGLLIRFDRERRTLARLHHTNIVPIFATGCEGELLYFAMPYLSGASLGQVIKTARSLESSGNGLASSSFEDLLQEARSRSQTASEDPQAAPAEQLRPTTLGVTEPVAIGSPKGPSSATQGPGPYLLSKAYIRTAVQVMAAVAEGVHHAHEAGVIHRDLKPSNIMIETGGHAWVLDFGLAALMATSSAGPAAFAVAMQGAESEASLTAGPVGTPPYMAPEQHQDGKQAEIRSDVWGLGVTLYELLTLQRAFPSAKAVLESEPVPLRKHNPGVARDLEAVVLKALSKDPAHRYPSSQAMADDLRHWLRQEPVSVWPSHSAARPAWRVWLWSKRNKGWAAAIGLALLGSLSLGLHFYQQRNAKERELVLQAIQRTLIGSQESGWSRRVWADVRRAADIASRSSLQPLAVAALVGLDAESHREFRDFGAHSLAFDSKGRLLMGGVTDAHDSSKLLNSRCWDGVSLEQPEDLGTAGEGPVGFRADDSPVQLVLNEHEKTLTLVDLSRRVPPLHFDVPGALALDNGDASPPIGMVGDGSRVAASVWVESGKPMLVVWNGLTGNMLHQFEARCHCIAFSPDGSFVAAGDDAGHVVIWSMETSQAVARLDAGNRINVVSFGRNPRLAPDGPDPAPSLSRWQLAAGDGGGTVTVWDLGTAHPRVRSICRGNYNEVFALSFSPDGSMLASAGRVIARLWDPSTGSPLLSIVAGQYQYGLAFSPDGRRLAIGSDVAWGRPGRVMVLEIIDGRGVRTLRGLSGMVATTIVSLDDSLVAAMSHDWRVGIWERETGRLKLVMDMPPGRYQDNAALAISPDNRLFAFSSDRHARLWEIGTGRVLGSWSLPVGLGDRLVFQGPDRLLLARAETSDPSVAPYGKTDPRRYSRSCAIYDLRGQNPAEPIRRFRDRNLAIHKLALSPDGTTLVIDGSSGQPEKWVRSIEAYDTASGARRWGFPSQFPGDAPSYLTFDPTGEFVVVTISLDNSVLVDAKTGQSRDVQSRLGSPGPGARLGISGSSGVNQHWLWERGREVPLLTIDTRTTPIGLDRFTRNGRFIIGSSPLGDWITVCDLAEIQRRLAEVGLGW